MIAIRTARLLLRPFSPQDAPALHAAVFGDDEAMRYMPPGSAIPLARVQSALEFHLSQWQERGYGVWAVTDPDSGLLMGQCGLSYLPELKRTEVLYALGRAHWGKGYATEAARAAVRYGFGEPGLTRIIALAAPENAASIGVMKKLGMAYRRDVKLWGMKLSMYAVPRDRWRDDGSPFQALAWPPR